ncbi:SPFH domain-containing protein [bacterium]|nr:SPFH domain-containing protein [bacterium]
MFSIIFLMLLIFTGMVLLLAGRKQEKEFNKNAFKIGGWLSVGVGIFVLMINSYTTVSSGHVKVASLFGKVQDEPLSEGLHFPVNPMLSFKQIDGRQKTHMEKAGIPSEDKLITTVDVSVQYRIIKSKAPDMVRNTGDAEAAIQVHMIPKLRSILREQGKGIKMAQDFFKESVQAQLQESLQVGLSSFLVQQGIQIDNVLIRGVILPKVIQDAITETKKREQEVIKQAAELERYAMEQDQIIKKAESELKAAKLEAEKKVTLADAEAYQIEVVNKQLSKSSNYIELKKVEQWDGVLPVYSGGKNVPMIDLRK